MSTAQVVPDQPRRGQEFDVDLTVLGAPGESGTVRVNAFYPAWDDGSDAHVDVVDLVFGREHYLTLGELRDAARAYAEDR